MKTLLTITGLFLLMSSSLLKAQNPPTASGVAILGEAYFFENGAQDESTTLTGSYTYNGSYSEGVTEYSWFRDGLQIAGANSIRYTLIQGDNLANITFKVKPVDNLNNFGATYTSAAVTVKDASIPNPDLRDVQMSDYTDNSGGTVGYLNLHIKGNKYYTVTNGTTVKIYGDLAKPAGEVNKVTLNITGNSTVIVYGQFIATDDMVINVEAGSTFTIVSGLDARDGASLAIDGNVTVNGDIVVRDNAIFAIAPGGSLAVTGDVTLGNTGSVTLDGAMSVGGTFDTGVGGTITVGVAGSLTVTGDLLGDAAIEGTGPVTVGGQVAPGINDTLGNQLTVLPVELVSFKASLFRDRVILHWITASEENNDYFTIERSTDGVSFKDIERVSGAGNSTEKRNYSYIDEKPAFGVNYYRLKQTDYDGQFSYSHINTITNLSASQLEIGPNPATNYIQISSPNELSGTIKILSNTGGQVLETSVSGQNETIDISFIQPGQYLVIFDTGKGLITKKLRVQ